MERVIRIIRVLPLPCLLFLIQFLLCELEAYWELTKWDNLTQELLLHALHFALEFLQDLDSVGILG